MNIFIAGSSGFIGRALAAALGARGHEVICGIHRRGSRPPADCAGVEAIDFTTDTDADVWQSRLADIDVVVNAVGILREQGGMTFTALHADAPMAMFRGALAAGVRRIVQISALGADGDAKSRYHLSKKAADDLLVTLPLEWVIVQPSLVFGAGGHSARLFTMLASLPIIPLAGSGDYAVQPIHRDDLVQALVAVVEAPSVQSRRVPLVGPRPLRFADFLAVLRESLGLGAPRFLRIRRRVAQAAAGLYGRARTSRFDRASLDMLFRGNTADVAATQALLGRMPRPADAFIDGDPVAWRLPAQLLWLLTLLRWTVALVWIATGVISVAFYPAADSHALLARAGVPAAWSPAVLYAAAGLDLFLGFASLSRRRRPWLWLVQAAVILSYTLIISVKLPEFWLHPYGPVLKNIPLLAAIWLLYELERKPWNT